jgi:sulfhydrogenase subunit gamma (sulfur reductase)
MLAHAIQSSGVSLFNPFIPHIVTVVDVRQETSDIRTLVLRFNNRDLDFDFAPGQFVEVSLFGYGEVPIGLASSPTRRETIEISVKRMGTVTSQIHKLTIGDTIGIRGPYGNGWPVDTLRGKNVLVIGGGIGLSPLRSLIDYLLDQRDDFGTLKILYGARTPNDLVYKPLLRKWAEARDTEVFCTVDIGTPEWDGHVGVVTALFEQANITIENTVVITCGPPIMIKFVTMGLEKMGFSDTDIITSMEKMMKCGIGKCGHCNIGSKYVCVDGPVFTHRELKNLPKEL